MSHARAVGGGARSTGFLPGAAPVAVPFSVDLLRARCPLYLDRRLGAQALPYVAPSTVAASSVRALVEPPFAEPGPVANFRWRDLLSKHALSSLSAAANCAALQERVLMARPACRSRGVEAQSYLYVVRVTTCQGKEYKAPWFFTRTSHMLLTRPWSRLELFKKQGHPRKCVALVSGESVGKICVEKPAVGTHYRLHSILPRYHLSFGGSLALFWRCALRRCAQGDADGWDGSSGWLPTLYTVMLLLVSADACTVAWGDLNSPIRKDSVHEKRVRMFPTSLTFLPTHPVKPLGVRM